METELDNVQMIRKLDQQGMLNILKRTDRQLEQAFYIGSSADLPHISSPIQCVVICALGGSAIAADLVRVYLEGKLEIPIVVNRGYTFPKFSGSSTLAVICSYSGNTEETICAYRQAQKAGCKIICLTSGGELGNLASESRCVYLEIPDGLSPRNAIGYMSVPLLVLFSRLGFVPDPSNELLGSLPWIRELSTLYDCGKEVSLNLAKQVALKIHCKVPIIYGSYSRLDMVAMRWRNQFCENGKQLAYTGALPEMNHNEIVGWKHPVETLKQFVPIFLCDRDDHPQLRRRVVLTRELAEKRAGLSLEYQSRGENWWERLWSLIILGDYASVYLSFLNQEDPTPVNILETFKRQLKTTCE